MNSVLILINSLIKQRIIVFIMH